MASTDGKRTLRFGVLCDTFELGAWQVECLEGLRQVGGCVPVVAVLNAAPRPRPGPLGRLIRSLAGGRLGWSAGTLWITGSWDESIRQAAITITNDSSYQNALNALWNSLNRG